jgi:hypothetical protein
MLGHIRLTSGEVIAPVAEDFLARIEVARLSVWLLGRKNKDNITGIGTVE